jgi:hypothetical protein
MDAVFEMSMRDFVCELLRLFGAKRQRDGVWLLFGRRVADETSEFGIAANEVGWRRWNVQSAAALVGPDGTIFWSTRPSCETRRVWSISELVRSVGYCRLKEEAAHAEQ